MAEPNPDPIPYLQHQLKRMNHRLYALEAESRLRWAGRQPRFPVEFTSQYGEDIVAWDLFGGRTEGFFIEAGAFDGYHYSVTYPFEAVGWTGLLVEAIPESYARCAQLRTGSRVIHAALSNNSASGETEFNVTADAFGGMLSHLPGRGYSSLAPDAPTRRVRVPVTNLNTLLADHKGEIDLVVLDVEGAEPDALDGFDLSRFRPKILLIESGDDPAIRERVDRHPYLFAGKIQTNMLFIERSCVDILERGKRMMRG